MSGKMTGQHKLRGQMALKSSPLNPSSGKLMSQHLVIDHMTAHYKKLINAKSAIDASVPKAYMSSQKVRDRETRKVLLGSKSSTNKQPSSARGRLARQSFTDSEFQQRRGERPFSSRPNQATFSFDDDELQGLSQEEIDCINAMVSDTIDSERLERVLNTDNRHQQVTARSGSSTGSKIASKGLMDSMNMDTNRRRKMSADILDKRTHVFSDGDMFTPRTLKNSKYKHIPSKLGQTKHFRPAKHRSPPPVNRAKPGYAASNTESEMLDETLMSRDFSTRLTMSGTVPKLDISIDQDHMKWLQEQSARHESSRYTPLEKELEMESKHAPYLQKSYTQQKIRHEDEQLAYLDFITEVTNDVLTRGIFTNRVLDKVFDEHVEKNKHRLSESRMRGMLDSLREDLGITIEDSYRDNGDDVGMGRVRPAVRSQTKTTGYNGDPAQFKTIRLGNSAPDTKNDIAFAYGQSLQQQPGYYTGAKQAQQTEADDVNPTLTDILEASEKSMSVSSKHTGASNGGGRAISMSASSKRSKKSSRSEKEYHFEKRESEQDVGKAASGSSALSSKSSKKSSRTERESENDKEASEKSMSIASKQSKKLSRAGKESENEKDRESSERHTSVNSKSSKKSSRTERESHHDKEASEKSMTASSKQTKTSSRAGMESENEKDRASSERHASVSSKQSRKSSITQPEQESQKKHSDPLLDLLGLEDIAGVEKQELTSEAMLMDEGKSSEKSGTSSHLKSAELQVKKVELGKGDAGSEKSSRWGSSIHKENSKTASGRTTPSTLTKQNSQESSTGEHGTPEEREDLESNVDFGKTTLFAKTRDMNLTYKALSQASDEYDVEYKTDGDDNF